MTSRIRLVLVDDHPIVLEGLALLFSLEPDFEVVGCAADGDQALTCVRQLAPDIVVLDIRMPKVDGLGVLRRMHYEGLATRSIVLTAAEGEQVEEAIRLGVCGVVLKDMAPKLLVKCIRDVHAGRKWFDRASATRTMEGLLFREAGMHAISHALTPRELQVARMAAKGMRNKAVALTMSITEGTAKLHLHNVYRKLRVDGRVGLVQYLHSKGLA